MLPGGAEGSVRTVSDNELGAFLRSRREAVTPAEVGLPPGIRRRTPGLRRAELATLAGISVEYLTRLEQGRDRHPSAQVLIALAAALRLPHEDRNHLRLLAKMTGGGVFPCQEVERPAREVRPTVRALLARFEPGSAYVVNRLGEVLAHTAGFARLFGPVGVLDQQPANLVRFVFTDPRARDAYPDWDSVADDHVAALKVESYRADPYVANLVEQLSAAVGAPFTARLASSTVLPRRTGVERLVHPEVGELRLAYESLTLPDADDQRLVVHLPADDATGAALDRLTGPRPGRLRAVTA